MPLAGPNSPRAPRRSRAARPTPPLGSLTQAAHRESAVCGSCGSERVTRLSMSLTDGTEVEFVSCHVCEERSWLSPGGPLSVDSVLDRTRKQ
ncbi:hypothetical protein MO973_30755 [Paenibacillus sp. TRM 82003]|uniref:hypothetical protein n=1 Tax=Kineococcus sp. TRM81007 TaxID=2925831 RepID=UPI001F5A8813|nr:hypothetical protein [Kineococcus sp. TRM81007]MCI2237872.1 hypothetical protein [Kineococcus sp. TRM81007]MCI3924603.1 hypothetical protein [Paenibacillus sp. TRM 82003]